MSNTLDPIKGAKALAALQKGIQTEPLGSGWCAVVDSNKDKRAWRTMLAAGCPFTEYPSQIEALAAAYDVFHPKGEKPGFEVITAANAELLRRCHKALWRLNTAEGFTVSTVLTGPLGEEIKARCHFAELVLEGARPTDAQNYVEAEARVRTYESVVALADKPETRRLLDQARTKLAECADALGEVTK